MSDCTNGGRNTYEPTCMIQIDFEGQERPWFYPIALNGRKMERVRIDGVDYAPTRWISIDEALPDTDEYVLASVKTKKGYRHVERAFYSGMYWSARADVEAWMPLPVPYGGER